MLMISPIVSISKLDFLNTCHPRACINFITMSQMSRVHMSCSFVQNTH